MIKKNIEDGIVIATLENGHTNSINEDMLKTLQDTVKEINETEDLKGLVLTGAGRFFSSGFDLPMFLGFKDHPAIVEFFRFEEQVLADLFTCIKPVVAAINGHAAAGGLILAMACDYRIGKNHPKIKYGMSEIKIGLPLSIVQAEVMRFGLDSDARFRDVMCFGEMYDVAAAKENKLIDAVAEEDELMANAKKIVSMWIDTPNRPFIEMKRFLKGQAAKRIKDRIASENWQEALQCFFKPEVRGALEFAQAMMQK